MSTQFKFAKLRNLIGGYFHQDWKEDFYWDGNKPNYEAVVRFYKIRNPAQTIEQATRELKEFLALGFDEDTLEDVLRDDFILCFRPQAIALTRREWLQNVLRILEEPMEKTRKAFIPDPIAIG